MMKQIYSCDICKEQFAPDLLFGCRFSGMNKFSLDAARSTNGTHICLNCARQIAEQLLEAAEKIGERERPA
jgi:hypothetical protein